MDLAHDMSRDASALLVDMANRLARIEMMLQQTQAQEQSDWLTPKELCKVLNITIDTLRGQVARGRIHGDAVKNVGTAKYAKLRYHRVKAVDQYLNRLPVPNKR